jgi:hypothetical protein
MSLILYTIICHGLFHLILTTGERGGNYFINFKDEKMRLWNRLCVTQIGKFSTAFFPSFVLDKVFTICHIPFQNRKCGCWTKAYSWWKQKNYMLLIWNSNIAGHPAFCGLFWQFCSSHMLLTTTTYCKSPSWLRGQRRVNLSQHVWAAYMIRSAGILNRHLSRNIGKDNCRDPGLETSRVKVPLRIVHSHYCT